MAKKEAEGSDTLIVKSKIREYIKTQGCNTSGALLNGDKLNNIIKELLDKAITRTKANSRKTVQVKDL